jgi:hypothetical protein
MRKWINWFISWKKTLKSGGGGHGNKVVLLPRLRADQGPQVDACRTLPDVAAAPEGKQLPVYRQKLVKAPAHGGSQTGIARAYATSRRDYSTEKRFTQ